MDGRGRVVVAASLAAAAVGLCTAQSVSSCRVVRLRLSVLPPRGLGPLLDLTVWRKDMEMSSRYGSVSREAP